MFLLSSCNQNTNYIQINGYAQGGTYTVKLNMNGKYGKVSVKPEQIKKDIDSLLNVIDFTLSGYNKGSILSKFNDGETVIANDMFCDIYALSYEFYESTEGALDVAAGPLFDAWGFGFKTDSLPSDQMVQTLMKECGMGRLVKDLKSVCSEDGSLSPSSLITDGSVALPKLNYNAIAQGYSCDVVAKYLHGLGVTDMLVDIGEIWCEGINPYGKPWTIGVDRPVDGSQELGKDIDGLWQGNGGKCGVVTSGNYRKFYVKDGKKFAHTIDPRTGYPVDHSLLSATIIAEDAATADALATYCMVIGLDQAKEFIQQNPSIEGYLIYDENGSMKEWASDGFNLVKN